MQFSVIPQGGLTTGPSLRVSVGGSAPNGAELNVKAHSFDRTLASSPRAGCREDRRGGVWHRGSGGLVVHLAFGHGGQLLVRRLFLVEVLPQQSRAIIAAEFLRPGD
jgi:hypothetical protein